MAGGTLSEPATPLSVSTLHNMFSELAGSLTGGKASTTNTCPPAPEPLAEPAGTSRAAVKRHLQAQAHSRYSDRLSSGDLLPPTTDTVVRATARHPGLAFVG